MYKEVIAALAILASGLLIGKPALKRYLVGCGLFFLPFSYDYTFYLYTPVENFFGGWMNGLLVRLSDIFFLLIFILCPRIKNPDGRSVRVTYWFDRVVILFLLVAVCSIPFAINRKLAAVSAVQFIKVAFLYYYIPSRFISWSKDGAFVTRWLAIALVFQCCLAGLQAVFQDFYGFFRSGSPPRGTTFGEFIRSQGTTPQPNCFAEYLTIIMLVLLSAMLSRGQGRKNGLGFAFVLGIIGLLTAMSRGGWLSFVVGVIFLLYYFNYLRKIRYWVGLGLCLGLLLLFVPQARQRLMGSDEGSAMDRYHLARIAAEIIKAHPVVGVGINNYRLAVYKFIPDDYEWSFIYVVHTLVLLIAAEMGILGLLAFLYLFARGIWVAWEPLRRSRYGFLAPGVAAACIAITVHNLFDIVWSSEIISSLFFFLLALASPMPAPLERKEQTTEPLKRVTVTVLPPENLVNA